MKRQKGMGWTSSLYPPSRSAGRPPDILWGFLAEAERMAGSSHHLVLRSLTVDFWIENYQIIPLYFRKHPIYIIIFLKKNFALSDSSRFKNPPLDICGVFGVFTTVWLDIDLSEFYWIAELLATIVSTVRTDGVLSCFLSATELLSLNSATIMFQTQRAMVNNVSVFYVLSEMNIEIHVNFP